MKEKIAIVVSGGGMRCSYSAGVLTALAKEFKFTNPNMIIAGSGSAGSAAYYVAKQYSQIQEIWIQHLSSKKMVNLFRLHRLIDIDYLIDEVFKKQVPLNIKNIKKSKINMIIPATNYDTGDVRYFNNKSNIFESLRATKALSVVYGKRIMINKKPYYDSFLSSDVPFNIRKAVSLGATKILIIDNDRNHIFITIFYSICRLFRNRIFRKEFQRNMKTCKEFKVPNNIKTFYFTSKKGFYLARLDNRKSSLEKGYNLGYKETVNNKELKKFLNIK